MDPDIASVAGGRTARCRTDAEADCSGLRRVRRHPAGLRRRVARPTAPSYLRRMRQAYTREERNRIAAAIAAAEGAPPCPACGRVVAVREVPAPPGVAYVRTRVLVVCPGCRRSAAVDARPGHP